MRLLVSVLLACAIASTAAGQTPRATCERGAPLDRVEACKALLNVPGLPDRQKSPLYVNLAEAYLAAGNPDGAVAVVDMAIRIGPATPRLRQVRAAIVKARAKTVAAEPSSPGFPSECLAEQIRRSVRQCRSVLLGNAVPPAEKIKAYRNLSDYYLEQQRPDDAKEMKALSASLAGQAPPAQAVVAPATPPPAPSDEPARAPFEPGVRVALVVGESDYRAVAHLGNARNDAQLIARSLRQIGFTSVDEIVDADRAGIIRALREFTSKADRADWAVIYYAGHGLELNGQNYIVPIDAVLASDRDVSDEAIPLDRLQATLDGARKLKMVVLDACRNNPFLASMQRSISTRSVGRGLARVEPDQATLVVFAAKEGTLALDGDGSNGPFATAFARRLVEPDIEINKLFRFVRQDVMAATNRRQEPFVYGSLPPEDFFFAKAR